MPIYEYRCEECGAEFQKIVLAPSREKELTCPECGAAEPKRKISLFAARGSCGDSGSSAFR